jgi:hypothetical protein
MMLHKELISGRWAQMNLMEQLANVGSEVSRASKWKKKTNEIYAQNSFERALELLDLTILHSPRLSATTELCHTKDELCKHFYEFDADEFEKLNRYFLPFALAARKKN